MATNEKKLIFKHADGTVRAVTGYLYEKPSVKSTKFKSKYTAKQLPSKVDMRSQMTEVEDQQSSSSCSANAAAGAYEYLVKKNQGIDYNVSRLFIYYNGREVDLKKGEKMEDHGAFIEDLIDQMKKKGCCSERTWPFRDSKSYINKKPSEAAYEEAKLYKVKEAEHIEDTLDSWRAALAEGYPIVFGMSLFDSFDKHRNGRIPDPSAEEEKRKEHGGHAMVCVGYSDVDKMFIVRNSWGKDWGDNGYCYISYNNIMKHNHSNSWILKNADEVADNEDEWDNNSESLFAEFNDELSQMSDDEWRKFNKDMGEYGLEYRLGALFLTAACADGDFSIDELDSAALHLANVLKYFKIKMKPKKILRNCLALVVNNHDFNKDTIDSFDFYLSLEAKANIYKQLWEVASADELHDDEEYFITDIAQVWFKDQDNYLDLAYPDGYFDNDDLANGFDYEDYDDTDSFFDDDFSDDDDDEDDEDYDDEDEDEEDDYEEDDEDEDEDDDYDDEDEDDEDDDEDEDEDEELEYVELDEEFDNMSSETSEDFDDSMGDYDFYERLSALFLASACADCNFTDEEFESAIKHIKKVLSDTGYNGNARVIFHKGMAAAVGIEDFIEDTIDYFNTYLSIGAKANIYYQLLEVASADDDINIDEEDYISKIAEIWFEDTDDWEAYAYPEKFF